MISPVYDEPKKVEALFSTLEAAVGLKKGGAKKTQHTVKEHTILSWKFNEWEFYKNTVPCQARGLFTENRRIAVRGYNKFFNIGEVRDTTEDALQKKTLPGYELTVKENGCIIFISGLEDGTIVVCSKHSTGQRDDLSRNHAVEGEKQLVHQLTAMGKKVEDLATELYASNVTLVAELCDDAFEEHILSYSEKESGLYIHGINYNTVDFQTVPMEKVTQFATKWGFKCVESFRLESYDELMSFLKGCGETGTYKGREIEGFVVRCRTTTNTDFFFKYKFEQPYLLYRHFREVTNQYIANKPYNEIIKKFTDVKYIIAKYLEFIQDYFAEFPERKEQYSNGHGIIAARKAFLASLGLNEISGMNLFKINEELSTTVNFEKVKNKYILVPIATVGCGKTTVAQTLYNLYNWPHIQNDNISSKSKNKLVTDCLHELVSSPVVFCDRNNHQTRERKNLFEQFDRLKMDYLSNNDTMVFIALNFIPVPFDKNDVYETTLERIVKRGDNHQSIKSDSDPDLAKAVLGGFVQRFQPLNTKYEPDKNFDLTINVNYNDPTDVSVKKIINTLKETYPELIEEDVSEEKLIEAIAKAKQYQPTFTKTFGASSKQKKTKKQQKQESNENEVLQKQKSGTKKEKKAKIDYFGIKVNHSSVVEIMDSYCKNNDLWNYLKSIDRVQEEFHVTLAHMTQQKEHNQDWETLKASLEDVSAPSKGFHMSAIFATVQVVSINICDALVCLEVKVKEFVDKAGASVSLPVVNKHPHITVGTFKPEIKPFVSNLVLGDLHQTTEDAKDGIYDVQGQTNSKVQVIKIRDEVVLHTQQLFSHYI